MSPEALNLQAHLQRGYSQQEVAVHVGLHHSTVSRIVQRKKEGGQEIRPDPNAVLSFQNSAVVADSQERYHCPSAIHR